MASLVFHTAPDVYSNEDESPKRKEKHKPKDSYNHSKALTILIEFLQPNSKTCLETAAESILKLMPESYQFPNPLGAFCILVSQLVEQIPYHHPAQAKLAWLIERLGWSASFTPWYDIKVRQSS
jgi:hypothetical protein